jgi:hypothetical protein
MSRSTRPASIHSRRKTLSLGKWQIILIAKSQRSHSHGAAIRVQKLTRRTCEILPFDPSSLMCVWWTLSKGFDSLYSDMSSRATRELERIMPIQLTRSELIVKLATVMADWLNDLG